MSHETLRAISAKLFEFPTIRDELTILWHAGEPLVLPPAYYETAISILEQAKPASLKLQFAFVTNGTLIDSDWTAFFKRHNVKVGVSIDGPQYIHDAQRITRSGRGTFNEAIRGVNYLRAAAVEFYVISVLTALSLAYPEDMYEFYASQGIKNVCFNIDEIEGPHHASSMDYSNASQDFKSFLSKFLSLATQSDAIENIRELSNSIGRLRALDFAHSQPSIANDQVIPFGMLSIAVDGAVSTFSPELLTAERPSGETFCIGNMVSDSVENILASPVLEKMRLEIAEGVANCRDSCAYFLVCGGGAPSNKFFENGTFSSTETLYCKLTQKAVTDVVLAILQTFEPGGLTVAPNSDLPTG